MPSHDARHVSRRSLLQGAATAGAAGLAVTALGAAVSPAAASESAPRAGGAAKAASGPLVVHVRDAKSGDIEVFHGTSKTRLRDKDLAARITQAAG